MKPGFVIASSCLLGLLVLTLAPHAAASATFPEALRKKLGLAELPYPPMGCQLCHKNDVGGIKTATKPFGRTVQKNGTTALSVPSLNAALEAIEADGIDSDGDGAPDIAELKAGTDPNVALSSTGEPLPMDEIPLPETGCALARARGASREPWALLLGSALSLGWLRRRASGVRRQR